MDDSAEVIRDKMQETRTQLSNKLETLENKVSDSVQSVSTNVSETVEAVKDTVETVTGNVQGAMHSVSEALDIRGQTDRHPWIVLGGSVALGCLAAQLFRRPTKKPKGKRRTEPRAFRSTSAGAANGHKEVESLAVEPVHSQASGAGKKSWFGEELNRLKGVAIGALMGVVRDMASRGLPEGVRQSVVEEVDHVNSYLGGVSIRRQQTNETPEAAHTGVATDREAGR